MPLYEVKNASNLVFEPPDLGCILHLAGKPGGGSRIYDGSPYGNHGSITGAAWRRLPGGAWCLYFDGLDDYVSCGNSPSFDIASGGTLKVWVCPEAAVTSYGIVLGKTGSDYLYYIYMDKNYGGPGVQKLVFGIKTGAGYRVADFVYPDPGRWYHLAGTWDSQNLKAYVNGNLTGSAACGACLSSPGDAINLGGPTGNRWYRGSLALARADNRAWSALEVIGDFNRDKELFGVW